MKNKTVIKNKKFFTSREKVNIVLTIVFSLVSLGFGIVIAFFGNGSSYIETDLITSIITLFGFGLTATVFVYQAFEKNSTRDTKNVINALSQTILLTLYLIIGALVFDFFESLLEAGICNNIIVSFKYAALIYAVICQFDIMNSFIIIITKNNCDDKKE